MTGIMTGLPDTSTAALSRQWIHKRGGITCDTTADPMWQPVIVTAYLAEPVVTVADPMHLDGPAAWAAYVGARDAGIVLPPLRPDTPPVDFALPMATWTAPDPGGAHPSLLTPSGDVWGWACSRAQWSPTGWTVAHTRKPPPTNQLARYTTDRKYHAALGPHKARNGQHQAMLADRIVWHALAQPDQLIELFLRLRAIGRLTRHGWGHILKIVVEPGHDRDAWRDRSWPTPGSPPAGVRAPYYHQTRRIPCSSTPPA